MFINDLTGPLYILDPRTKSATTYLDFNGRGPATGLFDKPTTDDGLASGLSWFATVSIAMPQSIDTMFQVASSNPSVASVPNDMMVPALAARLRARRTLLLPARAALGLP